MGEMSLYCTASHCPLVASCDRFKLQTSTDTDAYQCLSDNLIASTNGYECKYFVRQNITTSNCTSTDHGDF